MGFSKMSEGLRKRSGLHTLTLQNIRCARRIWATSPGQVAVLKTLTREFQLSVALGDLRLLEGKWYVTHSGLMRVARRNRCTGIQVRPMREYCDISIGRWVFRAIVYKTAVSKGFVGYGDADPSNVSALVRGAEMRVAETRAVNRALRKAYGIGLCSVEELGYLSAPPQPATWKRTAAPKSNGDGSGNGQARLRDRLCLLIRQHQLDPTLVKRYAADFCGTQELRKASRDLVESFITHLAEWAGRDRAGLLCKLNTFAQTQEVHS
jgi:hypothetical protein